MKWRRSREPRLESQWLDWVFERNLQNMGPLAVQVYGPRFLRYYHPLPEFCEADSLDFYIRSGLQVTVQTDQGTWRRVYQMDYEYVRVSTDRCEVKVDVKKTRFKSLIAWRLMTLVKFTLDVVFSFIAAVVIILSSMSLVSYLQELPDLWAGHRDTTGQTATWK